jgi:hypothetical protein
MSGKLIKPPFLWFIFLVVSWSASVSASSSAIDSGHSRGSAGISAFLSVKDKQLLLREMDTLEDSAVLMRACEIQKTKGWPPVSCFVFAKSEAEILELTEECRRQATRAPVLPALNLHVPEVCRKAIESRRLDLKYVKSGRRSAALR